jgi:hypothetical protein
MSSRDRAKPRGFDAAKADAFNLVQDYINAAKEGKKLVAGIGRGLLEICDGKPTLSRYRAQPLVNLVNSTDDQSSAQI